MDTALPTTSPVDLLQPKLPDKSTLRSKQAAEDFEAVFISQMLQPMFDTVETDGMFGAGSAEETWRAIMVEEIGKQMAKAGGIGLAPVVEKEMLRLQEVANGTH